MRPSILAAVALGVMAVAPAFAAESMTTTTATIESDSLPVVTCPAPIVITGSPEIVPAPTIVTPAPAETVVVNKKDKHLMRVGVPFLLHFDVF